MRKGLIILIILFALSLSAYANSGIEGEEKHSRPLEDVLQEIRESQGIGENEKIDPDRVSDELLEELGEAVMNIMHPDPREHEWMDNMMGGEGSSTLSSMHKIMGYNYLIGFYGGATGPGMMGWRTMGRGMMEYPPSSNPYHRGYNMMYFGYGSIIIWIVLILLIGTVAYFILQYKKMKSYRVSTEETPLDIIKKRYAKGEITKEEFERMRSDLE